MSTSGITEEIPIPHIPVHYDLYLNENDKLYRYGIDHPCGKVLYLRGSEIPIDNPTFDIEWIFELSEEGEIISTSSR